MESALEVLSRAATMIQNSNMETKQLPTTKWRRDRRDRLTAYFRATDLDSNAVSSQDDGLRSPPNSPTESPIRYTITSSELPVACLPKDFPPEYRPIRTASCIRGGGEHAPEVSLAYDEVDKSDKFGSEPQGASECPLDMTLPRLNRTSPPPYSQAINSSDVKRPNFRPTVITQAPATPKSPVSSVVESGSVSMCDPVIEEHFRRSLGDDYQLYLVKNAPVHATQMPYPQSSAPPVATPAKKTASPSASKSTEPKLKNSASGGESKLKPIIKELRGIKLTSAETEAKIDKNCAKYDEDFRKSFDTGLSVDDHFAKALGDTWTKIQAETHSGLLVNNSSCKSS